MTEASQYQLRTRKKSNQAREIASVEDHLHHKRPRSTLSRKLKSIPALELPTFPLDIWRRIFSMLPNSRLLRLSATSSAFYKIVPFIVCDDVELSVENYAYFAKYAHCIKKLFVRIMPNGLDVRRVKIYQHLSNLVVFRLEMYYKPVTHIKRIIDLLSSSLRLLEFHLDYTGERWTFKFDDIEPSDIFKNLPAQCHMYVTIRMEQNAILLLEDMFKYHSQSLIGLSITQHDYHDNERLIPLLRTATFLKRLSFHFPCSSTVMNNVLASISCLPLEYLEICAKNGLDQSISTGFPSLKCLTLFYMDKDFDFDYHLSSNLLCLQINGAMHENNLFSLRKLENLREFSWKQCHIPENMIITRCEDSGFLHFNDKKMAAFKLEKVSQVHISFASYHMSLLSEETSTNFFFFLFGMFPQVKRLKIEVGYSLSWTPLLIHLSGLKQVSIFYGVCGDVTPDLIDKCFNMFPQLAALQLQLESPNGNDLVDVIRRFPSGFPYQIVRRYGSMVRSDDPIPDIKWIKNVGDPLHFL